ncbi:MAG: phage holin family protein [Nocardioidaceae bacterium]|nr:phage holin family protein [Nocardioidaceae bacterium]
MTRILTTVLVNAVALAVAAWIFDGIRVGEARSGTAEDVITLVLVAALFGVVNAVIAPIVKLFSLPFIVLTLGLFLLVVNALMLLLTEEIADAVSLPFQVDGFWTAVGGALVISLVGMALDAALDRD